jgi:hypothetical protein
MIDRCERKDYFYRYVHSIQRDMGIVVRHAHVKIDERVDRETIDRHIMDIRKIRQLAKERHILRNLHNRFYL